MGYNLFVKETLRTALAMGADRAIHVEAAGSEYDSLQPLHISKILAKLAKDEKADIVIVGKQVGFLHAITKRVLLMSVYFFQTSTGN